MNQVQVQNLVHDAANQHHVYETETLKGVRDENWAKWYAQYLIDAGLTNNSNDLEMVRHILLDVQGEGEGWFEQAAKVLLSTFKEIKN